MPFDETTSGHWVKAKEVLTDFSTVRSFISGDGLPRVNADYRFCAPERRVRGVVEFGDAAEGMPGFVHGGAISGVFDEALGLLSWYLGVPVVTRELVVRYRTFVPVCSRVEVEGKLNLPHAWFVNGRAVMKGVDGTVHAAVQASFVELDPTMVAELAARNRARASDSSLSSDTTIQL
jgi:acyl-coenzyme A thioesterase PaaI-like protein